MPGRWRKPGVIQMEKIDLKKRNPPLASGELESWSAGALELADVQLYICMHLSLFVRLSVCLSV